MNRLLKNLLCVGCFLLIIQISGCANKTHETEKEANTDIKDIYITLTMNEEIVPDLPEVIEAVNKITEQKIGVHIHVLPLSQFDHSVQIAEMISQNKPVDVIIALNVEDFIENGYLLPLDDLLQKYGQDILKAVDHQYMELAKYKGIQYSIVKNRELATQYSICMRKDILEKYGFKVEDIKEMDDFEKVLEKVKKEEKNMNLYEPQIIVDGDELGDGIAVLMGKATEAEVVNFYKTEEFINQIQRIRRWREKGYIPGDGISSGLYTKERLQEMMKSGKLFSFCIMSKPGIDVQEGIAVGYELVSFPITDAVITTTSVLRRQWGIASTSKHPVEAMKFLNLLYTDKEIANLLCWGIEGKHYIMTKDGVLDYPQGIDASSTGYNFEQNWQLPGRYIADSWKGDQKNLKEAIEHFNNMAHKSIALGFQFDPSNIKSKYENVKNIIYPYCSGFLRGDFEIETVYPEFIKKLEKAGIEEIVKEKQWQLDQWMNTISK